MNPSRSKSALLVLPILLVFALGGSVNAKVQLDWFDHDFGSATVYAQLLEDGEEKLLMDGFLKFAYPHGFQIHYYTHEGPVAITGQNGFIEVRTGNEVQYGYDRYWLFEDVQNYLFALAEFSKLPLQFSGRDTVAGCPVKRYVSADDSNLVLWVHAKTGIPFLIREGKSTLVSVGSFTIHPNDPELLTSIELELLFAQDAARVTLELVDNSWVPSRLVLNEAQGEVSVEFSDWSFPAEWVDNPLPELAQLSELNGRFLAEFNEQRWDLALKTSQEMLSLAPQFWQAYLYRAFVYEALGNYLGVVENYQQVLMRQPDNHLALNNLAYHYFLREVQISQAIQMAERAVALERKDVYLDTLGYGYYLVGRYEEARELFEEALGTAPPEAIPEITEHLNLVLEALGELEEHE
ncbi:MAG: tetratricopeptide repeat protein [Firmicutes bacterium]|nr:tetratricopeptide repeat protein [Bacillota bacterium]